MVKAKDEVKKGGKSKGGNLSGKAQLLRAR
jgi:hypothetical protein